MYRQIVRIIILLAVTPIAGCTSTRNKIFLPKECDSFSFSPRLNWVTYMCNNTLWLAQLTDLKDAVPIIKDSSNATVWRRWVIWMPDERGFLLESYERLEEVDNLWLVKLDSLETRMLLATLPGRERAMIWSPTGMEIALIERGGGNVILIRADGSRYRELPIPGLVMETPSISWSPDGQKIAYTYIPYPEGLNAAEVRTIDLNTYQTNRIYAGGGLPEWFPDGQAIALFGRGDVIPVVRTDGSGIIKNIKIPDGYDIERSRSVWSPDGSRLALYLKIKGPDYKPVAVGILDREKLFISVFETPYFSEILGWTPDGKSLIVLSSMDDGTIVLREEPVVP